MFKSSGWIICLRIVAVIVIAASQLFGQATQGSIFGTVTDASGGVVPRAVVTVTSVEQGVKRTTTTNDAGQYVAPDLEVGSYIVSVQAPGFKRTVNPPVRLTVKARVQVDTRLQVGEVTQSVQVQGTSPLVQTGSAEVSTLVNNEELRTLPVISRNLLTLASLSAGTNNGTSSGRQAQTSGAEIIVNGNVAESNNFILDGVSDNMEFSGTIAMNPPIDAVQEFAVQTNQYGAEFGRSGGGIINIVLKSGTNQLHGFAYDYFQNDALNAAPFNFTGAFQPKQPLRLNRFGAGAGGPIKKDKLFWFANYEGLRNPSSSLGQETVPTAAEKTGDFSQAGFNIYDPATVHPDPNNSNQIDRNQFSGNVIPSSRFNPVGVGLLSYYPNPNFTSPIPGVTTNYLVNLPGSNTDNSFDAKGDWVPSAVDSVSGHFSQMRLNFAQAGWLPDNRLSTQTGEVGTNTGVTWTRSIRPMLLNEARVSYNRFLLPNTIGNKDNVMDQYNVPGWHTTRPYGLGFPSIGISNITGVSPVRELPWVGNGFQLAENVYQYLDTVSWVKGPHSIKFGAEYDHVREDRYQARIGGGSLSFGPDYTTSYVGQPTVNPENGVPDMLLGLATQIATQYGFDAIRDRGYRIGTFIQDDWRVLPKLTLNLGLRWDFYSPYNEEQDRVANLNPTTGIRLVPNDARSVVQNTLGLPGGNLPSGWAYVPSNQVNPQPQYHDFSPRFGLVYRLGQNGSFRGGYGIFYAPTTVNTFNNAGTEGNPFFFDFSITGTSQTPTVVANGFPSSGIESVLASPNFSAHYGPVDRPDPYAQKWSAHLEWSPANKNLLFDIGYDGEHGLFFPTLIPGNQAAAPGPTSLKQTLPYPNIGFFYFYMPIADTNYNGLSFSATARNLHGLMLKSAYTYSRALGYATGTDDVMTYRWNPRYDYGPQAYDITHRWTTSAVYQIPVPGSFHGAARALLGDWTTSGVFIAQTGLPFTAIASGANNSVNVGSLGESNHANIVGAWSLPSSQRTLQHYFNTSAFQSPGIYQFGNSSKDMLRGPGLVNLDFALQKQFVLPWKEQRLIVRMESSNFFNTPHFGNPNANLASSAFGQIRGLLGGSTPRQLQAVLKYEF
ncbi:MAG: TonB-dependent receptor domain-containing protein [Terriglobia bacterium]